MDLSTSASLAASSKNHYTALSKSGVETKTLGRAVGSSRFFTAS